MSDWGADRFSKINVPSAYQMVAEAIEREILSGRLRPGDEIGTEAELVRQFGVNRSTVREGIRLLENGGLVQREGRRKLTVCQPSYDGLSSRMSRALMLNKVTFREIYQTALILEAGAVEAAAGNLDESDIEALDANQALAEAAVDDPTRLAEIDTKFHALLAVCSRNRVLELAREPAALLFFPTSELICRVVPEGGRRMVEAHRHIIDALKAGDADLARTWMQRHVIDWKRGFERAGHDVDEPVDRIFRPLSGALFQ